MLAEAAGVDPRPVAGAPHRVTMAKMLGALRRDDRFRYAFRLHGQLPHGAQAVLLHLLREMARSPEPGVWRVPSSLPAGVVLARMMGFFDAEEAVSADLARLLAAGVVTERDGALHVAVDVSELVRTVPARVAPAPAAEPGVARPARWATDGEAAPQLRDKGGRPKSGEDRAQRKLRILDEAQHCQPPAKPPRKPGGNLGGKLPETGPENLGFQFSETGVSVSETSQNLVSEVSGFVAESTEIAAAASTESVVYPSAAAARKPELRAETAKPVSEKNLETSKPVSEVSEVSVLEVSSAARELAEQAAAQFHLAGIHLHEAVGIMQGYLDEGWSAVQVRAALAAKKNTRATSANMLRPWLLQHHPPNRARVAPPDSAPPEPARPHHPDLVALKLYGRLASDRQYWASLLFYASDPGASADDLAWVKRIWARDLQLFEVAAHYRPALWGLAGERSPAERAAERDKASKGEAWKTSTG